MKLPVLSRNVGQKTNLTRGSFLFTTYTPNESCLSSFLPINSFTDVRPSCLVMAVTRQFEKPTRVAFCSAVCVIQEFVLLFKRRAFLPGGYGCPQFPHLQGHCCISADDMTQSLVAAVVYVSAL